MNAIELAKRPAAYMITAGGQYRELFTPHTGGLLHEDVIELLGGDYTGAMSSTEDTTILFREDLANSRLPLNTTATKMAQKRGILPEYAALYGDVIWGFGGSKERDSFTEEAKNLPII